MKGFILLYKIVWCISAVILVGIVLHLIKTNSALWFAFIFLAPFLWITCPFKQESLR